MIDTLWFVAFIVMPAVAVISAFVALHLHRRSLNRHHHTPAE